VSAGFVRRLAGLKAFFSAMSAAASPAQLNAYQSSSGPIDITTAQATAAPTRGVPPFTYSWALASGFGWTVNSPTSASTSFTAEDVEAFQSNDGAFVCTVTDSTGATAVTNAVNAAAYNLGGGGAPL